MATRELRKDLLTRNFKRRLRQCFCTMKLQRNISFSISQVWLSYHAPTVASTSHAARLLERPPRCSWRRRNSIAVRLIYAISDILCVVYENLAKKVILGYSTASRKRRRLTEKEPMIAMLTKTTVTVIRNERFISLDQSKEYKVHPARVWIVRLLFLLRELNSELLLAPLVGNIYLNATCALRRCMLDTPYMLRSRPRFERSLDVSLIHRPEHVLSRLHWSASDQPELSVWSIL